MPLITMTTKFDIMEIIEKWGKEKNIDITELSVRVMTEGFLNE